MTAAAGAPTPKSAAIAMDRALPGKST